MITDYIVWLFVLLPLLSILGLVRMSLIGKIRMKLIDWIYDPSHYADRLKRRYILDKWSYGEMTYFMLNKWTFEQFYPEAVDVLTKKREV